MPGRQLFWARFLPVGVMALGLGFAVVGVYLYPDSPIVGGIIGALGIGGICANFWRTLVPDIKAWYDRLWIFAAPGRLPWTIGAFCRAELGALPRW